MLKLIHGNLITERTIEKDQTCCMQQGQFVEDTNQLADETLDITGLLVCPGLIDIHTHGRVGFDFMDSSEESCLAIARSSLLQGATTIIPTSLAGTKQATEEFLRVFLTIDKKPEDKADMPCVHLEGPYFAASQKGAQPEEYLRNPQPEEYLPIIEKYGCWIGRWSAASELEGMKQFAQACRKHDILVSYAHSDANYQQAVEANRWGFSHFTHLYSCMSSVHRKNGRRYGGLVEAAYGMEDTTVELISDGMHLPSELVNLAYKNKGPDYACLITDSMRAAGMPEGEYILGSKDSDHRVIVRDGVAWMPGFESFAGSVSSMIQVLRIAVQDCQIPLVDAVKMATRTPARIMGLKKKGSLLPGYDADCLILTPQLEIEAIIKAGKIVWKKEGGRFA